MVSRWYRDGIAMHLCSCVGDTVEVVGDTVQGSLKIMYSLLAIVTVGRASSSSTPVELVLALPTVMLLFKIMYSLLAIVTVGRATTSSTRVELLLALPTVMLLFSYVYTCNIVYLVVVYCTYR